MLRYDRQTKPGLVTLYDIRPETERIHSYNPEARTGPKNCKGDDSTAQGNITEWGHTKELNSEQIHKIKKKNYFNLKTFYLPLTRHLWLRPSHWPPSLS